VSDETNAASGSDKDASADPSVAQQIWDQVWPLAVAVMIAMGIRSVVIESYYVPSGSMFPTLLIGDHVFVNKFVYGARVPFTDIKLPDLSEPKRGSIAVFALGRRGPAHICPLDQCPKGENYPAEGFVKRLVGLPGDTIEFDRGALILNGERLKTENTGESFTEGGVQYRVLREHLGICVHEVLDDPRVYQKDIAEFTVPEGRYYFLGDNRDNSNDSRIWGTVPHLDLKGPVIVNYWSWNNREEWISMLNPLVWINLLVNEMRWGRIGYDYDCWSGSVE
jgi:signal peptidase I